MSLPESPRPAPDHRRVEEIAVEAGNILDLDDRTRFLQAACGDEPALLAEVVELLDGAETGRTVGGYRLLEVLGRGGMGVVYRAESVDGSGETVALKLLPLGLDTAVARQRFRRERETLGALDHPAIARLLDGGVTEDGTPYMVMEHVEGRPIHELADERGLDRVLRLFCEALDAVQAAHDQGIVHRDLKPDHILITPQGRVKLLDFGVSKVLEDGQGPATTLTHMAGRPVTLRFASPEHLRGEAVTPASDVYSLGVVLYRLLTGTDPIDLAGLTMSEAIQQVGEEIPPRPSTRVEQGHPDRAERLRGDLDVIVLKALRKAPKRRYPSAGAMAEDLRRHLDARTILARPPSLLERGLRTVRRRARSLGTAAVAGSLLAGVWVLSNGPVDGLAGADSERDLVLGGSGITLLDEPPPSVRPGVLQNDTALFLFHEGRTRLSRPLRLEITGPKTYTAGDLRTPGLLGPGREVQSWYLHFDPASDPSPRARATLTFPEPVLGLIIGLDALIATDSLLGTERTRYAQDRGSFRGVEFFSDDRVTLHRDRRRLDVDLAVAGQGTDALRVITGQGGLETTPLPEMSATLLGLDAPASLTEGTLEQRRWGRLVPERTVKLPRDLMVDASDPGLYSTAGLPAPRVVPAGTWVRSYLLHFDPPESVASSYILGRVRFERPVVGLLIRGASIAATDDLLGLENVAYPTDPDARGPELAEGDWVRLGAAGRMVTWLVRDGSYLDQIRVLVPAEAGDEGAVAPAPEGR